MSENVTKSYVQYAVSKAGLKGEQGERGLTGASGPSGAVATIAVGTVTTLGAGASAAVSNSGLPGAAVLDFCIPRGDKGDTGDTGLQGPQGIQGEIGATGAIGAAGNGISSVSRISGTHAPGTSDTYRITFTDTSTYDFQVYNGADGEGAGDMLKSAYDTDNDGIVDSAGTLSGLTASTTQLNYMDGVTSPVQNQLDGKVGRTGNEAVAGIKTFGSFPLTPSAAPSSDYETANKKYVDDSAGASFLMQSLTVTSGSAEPAEGRPAWIDASGQAFCNTLRVNKQTGIASGSFSGYRKYGSNYFVITLNPTVAYKFDGNFDYVGSVTLDSSASETAIIGFEISGAGIGHVLIQTNDTYGSLKAASFNCSTMDAVTALRTVFTASSSIQVSGVKNVTCSGAMSFPAGVKFVFRVLWNDTGAYGLQSLQDDGADYEGLAYTNDFSNQDTRIAVPSAGGYKVIWNNGNYMCCADIASDTGTPPAPSQIYVYAGTYNGAVEYAWQKSNGDFVLITRNSGTYYYAVIPNAWSSAGSYGTIQSVSAGLVGCNPSYVHFDGTYVYLVADEASDYMFRFARDSFDGTWTDITSTINADFFTAGYSTGFFYFMQAGAPTAFSLASILSYPRKISDIGTGEYFGIIESVNGDGTVDVRYGGAAAHTFDFGSYPYMGLDNTGNLVAGNGAASAVLLKLSDTAAQVNPPSAVRPNWELVTSAVTAAAAATIQLDIPDVSKYRQLRLTYSIGNNTTSAATVTMRFNGISASSSYSHRELNTATVTSGTSVTVNTLTTSSSDAAAGEITINVNGDVLHGTGFGARGRTTSVALYAFIFAVPPSTLLPSALSCITLISTYALDAGAKLQLYGVI